MSEEPSVNEEWRKIEEWKTIEAFPNYAVSNLGRVKRILTCTGKPIEDRVLSPYIGWRGARMVNLSDKGRHHSLRIARLVATAFLPNPDRRRVVLHKDGDILNDRLDNLQWVSRQEFPSLSSHGRKISEARKIPVTGTDVVTCATRTFPSLVDAVAWLKVLGGEKNASSSHICECCRGRLKTAYGYSWEYAEDEYGSDEVD